MNESNRNNLLYQSILECRENHAEINFSDLDLKLSLNDAYSNIFSLIQKSKKTISAWKLGGTNQETQDIFNVNKPYFGPLFYDEVFFVKENKGPLPELPILKGEVEIALRITELGSKKHKNEKIEAGLIFDAWSIAIEFPYSVFSDIPESGVEALVADRCAAGALVLGQINNGLPPKEFSVGLLINGMQKSVGNQEDLLMSPVDIAMNFRNLAIRKGFRLEAGQWVSTGGLTSCLSIDKKDIVRLEFCNKTIYTLEN